MLKTIARIVVALQGAAALFIALNLIADPVTVGGQLGFSPIGDLGLASLRGDVGGLFAGAGVFMLWAAWQGDRAYLVPPLVFVAIALAARTVSLAMTGFTPELVPPMVVEGLSVALLLAAHAMFAQATD
jgi:hypothetical protein